MIVAWHEVPRSAPPQKSRPVGYGMIRAGVRTDSKIGGEISNAVSLSRMEMVPKCLSRRVFSLPKETRRIFRREKPVGSAAPDHTVPYGTGSFEGRFPRHFVPGYDQPVSPGQKPFAHRRTSH